MKQICSVKLFVDSLLYGIILVSGCCPVLYFKAANCINFKVYVIFKWLALHVTIRS